MDKHVQFPLSAQDARQLRAGERCLLSGVIYTARDAAHKRLCATISAGEKLPVLLENQALYFVGPTPAKPHQVIGSAGPTTSGRMDAYSPILIEHAHLRAMIGKGERDEKVIESMKRFSCLYFAAIGGAGALLSQCITAAEVVCYDDLGTEAIHKLTLKNFPVIVAIDTLGHDLYHPQTMESL